jgi:hypothetical protein
VRLGGSRSFPPFDKNNMTAKKIIDSILHNTGFIRCEGCNNVVGEDEIVKELSICLDCYMAYQQDMQMVWGEPSECEEYVLAHD